MSNEAHEFEVTVTVRKRIWASGGTREAMRDILKQCIPTMGFGPFAKLDEQGKPIETLISNEIEVEDVK